MAFVPQERAPLEGTLMLICYVRENETFRQISVDASTATPDNCVTATWFDLFNPTPEEDRLVESCLKISIPSREEMEEIESSARLYTEEGAEFMTVTVLTDLDTDHPSRTPVTFILKGNRLVTVRYADPRPFKTFIGRLQKPNRHSTGELIMLGLLEAMIDRLADALEHTSSNIDAISREVFRSNSQAARRNTRNLQLVIEQIGQKGDFLGLARESLVSLSRLLTYHRAFDIENAKLSKEARQQTKVLQRDVASLSDHDSFLSAKINFLLDATLGLINLEQNQIIKIFSVAAVVFLPPTLVASIYGMNFDFMPELKWLFGYPFAIFLMVASAILPYMYFKRRGWL
jgi:magnesium transporter